MGSKETEEEALGIEEEGLERSETEGTLSSGCKQEDQAAPGAVEATQVVLQEHVEIQDEREKDEEMEHRVSFEKKDTNLLSTRTASIQRQGAHVFAVPAIESIHHRSSVITRDGRRIREACKKYLDVQSGKSTESTAPHSLSEEQEMISLLLEPLILCCQHGSTRTIELALSCLHKLVSLGFLCGETELDGSLQEDNPLTRIVKTTSLIATAHESKQVQLSVIRLLLSAITSKTFILHGACLLEAVRTIYNIHLVVDYDEIKRAAQGALEQSIGTLLQRTCIPELYKPPVSTFARPLADLSVAPAAEAVSVVLSISEDGHIHTVLQEHSAIASTCDGAPPGPKPPVEERPRDEDFKESSKVDTTLEATEDIESSTGNALQEHSLDKDSLNGFSERLNSLAEKGDVKAMESVLNDSHLSESDGYMSMPNCPAGEEPVLAATKTRYSPFERDAFLVLRALCVLASREAKTSQADQDMLGSKCLSLELLCKTLSSGFESDLPGVSLTTHPFEWERAEKSFVFALQHPLSICLLRNCLSPQPKVCELVAELFTILLKRPCLREEMKTELGAFYPLIILKPLENPGSAICQQEAALKLLLHVSQEPQLLVDIFVNFDCELHAMNLYERTVNALAIFLRRNTFVQNATEKQDDISTKALLCVSWIIEGFSKHILTLSEDSEISDAEEELEELDGRSSGRLSSENVSAMKNKKVTLESCISAFNKKPSHGVKILTEGGAVSNSTPAEIAAFLTRTPGLDKNALGEFLGCHGEIEVAAMHAYVDSFDFSGTLIDEAIRVLLSGFRLPGEAQKIDRIMEKFAERYCATNPEVFANADEAYVLSYAIIILNTDAHNPMVKHRMSKQEFIGMAGFVDKSTGDEDETAQQRRNLLSCIYDRITENEIQLKDGQLDRSKSSARSKLTQPNALISLIGLGRAQDTALERERLIELARKTVEQCKRASGGSRNTWKTIKEVSTFEPMFELCGDSLLECLRIGLKSRKSANIDIAVESHELLLSLAHHLGLARIQENCIKSLSDTAHLCFLSPNINAYTYQGLIGKKAASTLLKAAGRHGNAIGNSWLNVLRTVSRMEDLRLFCAGEAADGSFFSSNKRTPVQEQVSALAKFFGRKEILDRQNKKSTGYLPDFLRTENGSLLLERVFSQSSELNADSIVEFMYALCTVSSEELSISPPAGPRIFSLQKLVEAAYFNLARIRFIWSRLWSKIAPHLANAGCHENERVAMYAVDSLRQLGAKVLEREELSHFRFQSDALRPFASILRSCKSTKVKELAVQCLSQLAAAYTSQLQSGWDSIWTALSLACSDNAEVVAGCALESSEGILLSLYSHVFRLESFTDMATCGSKIATNDALTVEMRKRGVIFLGSCGRLLGNLQEKQAAEETEVEQLHSQLWIHLAVVLSDVCRPSSPPDLQSIAAEVLFGDLIIAYGLLFDIGLWKRLVDRVLVPLFTEEPDCTLEARSTKTAELQVDDVLSEAEKEAGGSAEHVAFAPPFWWLESICANCLVLLSRTASEYPVGCASLLPFLKDILTKCATLYGEEAAQIVVDSLNEFVKKGKGCNWDMVAGSYSDALLSNAKSTSRAEVTVLFQGAISSVCQEFWVSIPNDSRMVMLDALKKSVEVASSRMKNGLAMDCYSQSDNKGAKMSENLEAVWKQEMKGSMFFIGCMERAIQLEEVSSRQELLDFCFDVLVRYSSHLVAEETVDSNTTDIRALYLQRQTPVILKVLDTYKTLDEPFFKQEIRRAAPRMFELTCSPQLAVRKSVGELLHAQVSPLLCGSPK